MNNRGYKYRLLAAVSSLVLGLSLSACGEDQNQASSEAPAETKQMAEMDHSQHQMPAEAEMKTEPASGEMDHSQHDMSGMAGMSHSGHDMSPAMLDELRAKIPLYANYSDQEIALSMEMMGGNYESYLSGDNVTGEAGVLVLAHGFRKRGDDVLAKNLDQLSQIFPTAVGYGMSMMTSAHIQSAVDKLTAKGAKRIVVIPAVSNDINTMKRQWEYILNERDEAAFATVPQVDTQAEVIVATAIDDNPLAGEMLLDFADEIGEDPSNEVVLIVSHGPSYEEDNVRNLEMLSNLSRIIKEDGGYHEVQGFSLQDDATPELRKANVEKLRAKISEVTASGKEVLIVTNLMSTRSIQHKIREDLAGLDYKFNTRSITQHENFSKWIMETVRYKLEQS